MEPVELRTERLVLSAPTLDDADAITAACQDYELQRRVGIPVPYTHENAVGFIAQWSTAGWEKGTNSTWVVRRDGEFAGIVGLDDIRQGEATVGYWLDPAHRGLGILSEALPVVLDFAFAPDGLALERVQWRAFSGNLASARVAQKSGLRFEGIARLGVMGRAGREDDWMAGILSTDDRTPQPWPVLP
ncbi:MAG TPA: GNAT family N-acetyltransferase [Galbitalea sp.]|jgi:RimJ/RimL family protein N-acetyltransferase